LNDKLIELFNDEKVKERIRIKLPKLFRIAELESSRAGKVGMEVGTMREKILIALLIYKFGEENVQTNIPITEYETDVKLFDQPISIKTITGNGNVKVVWTVDQDSAIKFIKNYKPKCDILLAQIKWDLSEKEINRGIHPGGLFLIPTEVQTKILHEIGINNYLNMPKKGTNPRGVEISKTGLSLLLKNSDTECIEINWKRTLIKYNPYKRWVDYWKR